MDDGEWLRDLVRRAGEHALAGASRLRWEYKADASPVTNLDREVEALLRDAIRDRFPADAIWGEEAGGERRLRGRTWVLDPIDGTTNLVLGIPIWAVSAGLVIEGVPALGAIFQPITQELFWFEAGQGAFRNGERLQVATADLGGDDTIAVAYEAFRILDVADVPGRMRSLGSVVAHLAYVARGAFRAAVGYLLQLHDLGAAYGLVREAGCAAEWLSGGEAPLTYWFEHARNDEPLLVGPGPAIRTLRSRLRRKG